MRVFYLAMLLAWVSHAKNSQRFCLMIKRDLRFTETYQNVLEGSTFQVVAVGVKYVLLWVIVPGTKKKGDEKSYWIASDITCECFALRLQKRVSDKHICQLSKSNINEYHKNLNGSNINVNDALETTLDNSRVHLADSPLNIIEFLRHISLSSGKKGKKMVIECLSVKSVVDFRKSQTYKHHVYKFHIFDRIIDPDSSVYILVNAVGERILQHDTVPLEKCNYSDEDSSKARMNIYSDKNILYTFAKFYIPDRIINRACFIIKRNWESAVTKRSLPTLDIAQHNDKILILAFTRGKKGRTSSDAMERVAQWICEEASALLATHGTAVSNRFPQASSVRPICSRIKVSNAYACKRCIGFQRISKLTFWGGTDTKDVYNLCSTAAKKGEAGITINSNCEEYCVKDGEVNDGERSKIFLAEDIWNEILNSRPDLPFKLAYDFTNDDEKQAGKSKATSMGIDDIPLSPSKSNKRSKRNATYDVATFSTQSLMPYVTVDYVIDNGIQN